MIAFALVTSLSILAIFTIDIFLLNPDSYTNHDRLVYGVIVILFNVLVILTEMALKNKE